MGTFVLKRKTYTVYDDTDSLKRMKDADILAEKEKSVNYLPVVTKAATGAGIGALSAGAVAGAHGLLRNKGKWGFSLGRAAKAGKKGLLGGAIAGASIIGGLALHKKANEQEEASMYNKRLRYAQRQAKRREKADWKTNMTTRDGYSY
jgi:hypothetical protein